MNKNLRPRAEIFLANKKIYDTINLSVAEKDFVTFSQRLATYIYRGSLPLVTLQKEKLMKKETETVKKQVFERYGGGFAFGCRLIDITCTNNTQIIIIEP